LRYTNSIIIIIIIIIVYLIIVPPPAGLEVLFYFIFHVDCMCLHVSMFLWMRLSILLFLWYLWYWYAWDEDDNLGFGVRGLKVKNH